MAIGFMAAPLSAVLDRRSGSLSSSRLREEEVPALARSSAFSLSFLASGGAASSSRSLTYEASFNLRCGMTFDQSDEQVYHPCAMSWVDSDNDLAIP